MLGSVAIITITVIGQVGNFDRFCFPITRVPCGYRKSIKIYIL